MIKCNWSQNQTQDVKTFNQDKEKKLFRNNLMFKVVCVQKTFEYHKVLVKFEIDINV